MVYRNTKWMKLYTDLKNRLIRGEWAENTKLPSIQELAKQFGVSYLTAQKIIRHLADEGRVKIIHAQGIYAARPDAQLISADHSEEVQLMMQVCGDFFSEIYLNFQQNLPREYRIGICEPFDFVNDTTDEFRHRLKKLSKTNCRSLVFHGNHLFNFQALATCRPLPFPCTIAIHDFGWKQFQEFNRVLCDFEDAGYQAASQLLAAGYDELFFLTHERLAESEYALRGLNGDVSDLMLRGIKRACSFAGVLFPGQRIIRRNYTPLGNHLLICDLKKIMAHSTARLGFITISDNRAFPIYQAAEKMGREIGVDVGVIGCYNCRGCCSNLYPALTTISFNEARIGAALAELTANGATGEHILIHPQVIERASVSRKQSMLLEG